VVEVKGIEPLRRMVGTPYRIPITPKKNSGQRAITLAGRLYLVHGQY